MAPPDYYLVEKLDFSGLVFELARARRVDGAFCAPESFEALTQAIERGERVLSLELPADVTRQEQAEAQGQIDSAANDLSIAIDGLVLVPPRPSIAQLAMAGVAALAMVGAVVASCFVLFRMVKLIDYRGQLKLIASCLGRSNKLTAACRDFSNSVSIGDDAVRFGESFCFGKSSHSVIPYDDIMSIYLQVTKPRGMQSPIVI